MRYCNRCGFPEPYGNFLVWTTDGTIIGNDASRTRLIYVEVDELNALYGGLAQLIRMPIDDILFRAEKEVGKRFIRTLLPAFIERVPRGRIVRPEAVVRIIAKYVFNYMAGLGMGRATILEYKSGEFTRFILTEPHVAALIAGDGAGVFESIERVSAAASWEKIRPDTYLVTVSRTEDAFSEEERLRLEPVRYRRGDLKLEKCPDCGVAKALTDNLYLDLDRGLIRHKTTGSRFVAVPVDSFDAVIRLLAVELGEGLSGFMLGIAQRYQRENSDVRGRVSPGSSILSMFEEFPWLGIGNPLWAGVEDNRVIIMVENAFRPELVAGRVAGIYEAWTGDIVRATWVEEVPGRMRVELELVA